MVIVSQPTFAPSKVLEVALALREDGSPPDLCFGTDEKPIHVGQCLIYAVRFSDEDIWAVRIPVHQNGTLPPSSISGIVEDEMAMLTKLWNLGFRWSPKLIGGDSTFDNSLGHPYLVMTWVHGTSLDWTPSVPADQQTRCKILRQLADIQLDLVYCTMEKRKDSLVPMPSSH